MIEEEIENVSKKYIKDQDPQNALEEISLNFTKSFSTFNQSPSPKSEYTPTPNQFSKISVIDEEGSETQDSAPSPVNKDLIINSEARDKLLRMIKSQSALHKTEQDNSIQMKSPYYLKIETDTNNSNSTQICSPRNSTSHKSIKINDPNKTPSLNKTNHPGKEKVKHNKIPSGLKMNSDMKLRFS